MRLQIIENEAEISYSLFKQEFQANFENFS